MTKAVINHREIRTIVLFIFLIIPFCGHSQKITHIKSAVGICTISNITPEEARKVAIEEAKNAALIQAGVNENVMVYSSFEVLSTNESHLEYFSSLSNIMMQGQILNWEIIDEKRSVNEFNNFQFEITIKADVIKYETTPDPNFSAEINGIKPVYYEDDPLEFNVVTSQKGYLYLFLLGDSELTKLYPNDYEKEGLFDPMISYKFPIDENIEYSLTVQGDKADKNTLVFVMTKEQNAPLVSDSKAMYKWLYSQERNSVFYTFYSINILKQ